MKIEKVAVVGAGVMGASIAAHISNAGIPVYLLDIVPEDTDNRNIIAETALQKLLKAEPAALMHPKNARLITTGNIEDHLDYLTEVDWVIEAVIEDLKVKQTLYQLFDGVCRSDALISSNTSTLPLALLSQKMPDSFKQRFMITHFFNPPRYMRLLELVADKSINPKLLQTVTQFADFKLGKGCVTCKDTPGFIANRIGTFWLQCGLLEAIERKITIEQADGAISAPFGIPKTGIFGLLDLVGLDLIPHILAGFKLALPADDAFHQINRSPELLKQMIADGYTGRKGKGGFYRLQHIDGKKVKESIDLANGQYSKSSKLEPPSFDGSATERLQALLSNNDPGCRYAWQVMSQTLCYAARLIPEIADDVVAIDRAMKLGYNWKFGPFELLDRIGIDWFVDKLKTENRNIPDLLNNTKVIYKVDNGCLSHIDLNKDYHPVTRADGVLLLADIKLQKPALLSNPSASLWDIGDGVACLEFHSKMNTLDMDMMALIRLSLDKVKQDFDALIIHNEDDNFSAGANLGLLMYAINKQDWTAVEELVKTGQKTYQAIKYAPFPVVGAPSGLALGGGCEILLHCDAIQAHAELYMGLVEVGVGLVPAWGGCKEFLRRQLENPKRPGGPMPPLAAAFETIAMAKVSKSAIEAKEMLFVAKQDGITINKDRLLADAKSKALSLVAEYITPKPIEFRLPGKTAKIAMKMAADNLYKQGIASKYDVEISSHLADILSGGNTDLSQPLTEDCLLSLELKSFLHLVKQPSTLARLEHMLTTGKPLRN